MKKLLVPLLTMLCAMCTFPVQAKYVPNEVVKIGSSDVSVKLPASHDIMDNVFTDLECLGLNIYHESRGESELGQELVAQVTMNRVENSNDKSVCDIVRQKNQFSWTNDGKSDLPQNPKAYVDALLIGIKFLEEGYTIDIPHAKELTNFHSYKQTPKSWNVDLIVVEGGHRFYAPKGKVKMDKRVAQRPPQPKRRMVTKTKTELPRMTDTRDKNNLVLFSNIPEEPDKPDLLDLEYAVSYNGLTIPTDTPQYRLDEMHPYKEPFITSNMYFISRREINRRIN